MKQFVCVRLVQANAMDLSLFQFDYDLTFAAFFLNADRTLYGRFGSRSDGRQADREITMEGFRKALATALDLHRHYPRNNALLAGKQPVATRFRTPEEYPSLTGKYKPTLDYEGKVARSCLHCHQVGEAQRRLLRTNHEPMPDDVLFPWPMPDVIGLSFDPREKAKAAAVAPDSPAAAAGFKAGDEIVALEGQPMLSIADVQWVLHNARVPAKLHAQVLRGRRKLELVLALEPGWRRHSDISWRTTTWDLRRMVTGGMVLKTLPPDKRPEAGLSDTQLALVVEYLGEYGEHAVAKKAGLQKSDVIIGVDGRSASMTESELMAYLLQKNAPGASVSMTVRRGGERKEFELPMQ